MEMSLAQKAISLALHGEWSEAIKINLEILSITPEDTDSLNRLAKAYAETGKIELARKTAQKVLKIDPLNGIASKCFAKWQTMKDGQRNPKSFASPESFLEDPGKTKLVPLMNPGDDQVLAGLDCGDTVKLATHPHSISVVTQENKNIGKLPDDLAARLNNLIKSGGSMGGPGAVMFNFESVGFLLVKKSNNAEEDMLKLIDAGVEDVNETSDGIEVYVAPDKLGETRKKLQELGFEVTETELQLKPKNVMTVETGEQAEKAMKFLDSLEENDDVQRVFSNLDIPEGLIS